MDETEFVYTSKEGGSFTQQETDQLRGLLANFPIHNHDGRNSQEVATRKVKASVSSQYILSPTDMTAGEAIANGQALRITGDNFVVLGHEGTRIGSTSAGLGTRLALAQAFTISNFDTATGSGITGVGIYMTSGNTTYKLSIVNDNSGAPGSTVYASQEKSLSSAGTFTLREFTWTAWLPTAGTTYWMVLEYVSGSSTAPIIDRVSANVYSNGRTNALDNWIDDPDSNDWWFQMSFTEATSNKIFKANALGSGAQNLFVGISNADVAGGDTIPYITFGTKRDFSGLTQGVTYYISNTAGTIATTPGRITMPVGRSLSDEILLIQPPSLT